MTQEDLSGQQPLDTVFHVHCHSDESINNIILLAETLSSWWFVLLVFLGQLGEVREAFGLFFEEVLGN